MSPRTEETNLRIREEQRKKILDAAKKVFAHKGFASTKMTDIATAADVSYGLAYHYFTNKEEIFARLVESALQGTVNLIHYALERPGAPWDRLHWMASEMLMGMQRDPEFSIIVLQALTNDTVPRDIQEMARKQSDVIHDALKQLVVEGQAAGQVASGDPERLITIFFACLQGLSIGAFFRSYSPTSFSIPDVDSVLRILKP